VSTQLGFDLAGLIAAIERGDLNYQLALYADDAQLRVADPDPHRSPSVYSGKDEIGTWLQRLDLQQVNHQLTDLTSTDDRISLTDRIRYPDGRNLVYQMSLQLDHGQILNQTATLTREDLQA
jgi:hypothetical protein